MSNDVFEKLATNVNNKYGCNLPASFIKEFLQERAKEGNIKYDGKDIKVKYKE